MLTYSAESDKKAVDQGISAGSSPLEYESAGQPLQKYLTDIPIQDRAMPGTDPKFDDSIHRLAQGKVGLGPARRDPRGPARGTGQGRLSHGQKVEAFRKAAFKAMEDEELANPGRRCQ